MQAFHQITDIFLPSQPKNMTMLPCGLTFPYRGDIGHRQAWLNNQVRPQSITISPQLSSISINCTARERFPQMGDSAARLEDPDRHRCECSWLFCFHSQPWWLLWLPSLGPKDQRASQRTSALGCHPQTRVVSRQNSTERMRASF